MWIAKDKTNEAYLKLFDKEPIRLQYMFVADHDSECLYIPLSFYPTLTWENSPREIESITIKLKQDVDSER